ncbi:endo alpha-1,4 polygalactosaminidase [Streptomyces sp. enrichment culture]|uniref:endo alpha-1,4 polygalactosaminidase n=1 Tax=Streptomyces sp. enrichment culture TaxID=1795815 RepID=UPI003F56DECA
MSLLASTRSRVILAACAAAACGAAVFIPSAEAAEPAPPPVHAGFDYQIGKPYTPPENVTVVSRDWQEDPAEGLYNICYVNAFQTQEEGEDWGPDDWDQNLLLKDADGVVIKDEVWNEGILDITSDAKRQAIAEKINEQIDTCAAKGFDALELDNYDSFTREAAVGRISEDDAQTYMRMLSAYGHDKGLAVGQKNTLELAANHEENGLDFAIAEECGDQKEVEDGVVTYDECAAYIEEFGNNVIMIEYTDEGMANACEYGDRVSVVQRDTEVLAPDEEAKDENGEPIPYLRKTCPAPDNE